MSGRGLAVLAAAGLAQAFLLFRAFHFGPMAGLVPWDDCLTLQRALYNLRVLTLAGTPLAMAGSLLAVVIHSPISDLQAMLGLVVGGGALWAPFALNLVAVLVALHAVLFRAGRPDGATFLALLLFLLVQPLTLEALTFLKADWKGGLLIAAALVLLYEAAEQDRRDLTLYGAGVLGAGIAAKLTAFYMPVFAVLALVGFEAAGYAARPQAQGLVGYLRARWPTLRPALALALGPFTLFFFLGAVGHHRLVAYILYAAGDTWSDGRTPWERALYYSPFAPGGGAWGMLGWSALAFVAAALGLSIRARRWLFPTALLVMAGLALVLMIPLVVARTSNLEFGASLLGVITGAALIAIRVAARQAGRRGPLAALVIVAAFCLVSPLEPPFLDTDVGKPSTAELQRLKGVYAEVVEDIAAHAPATAPKVRLFYENSFAPFPDLSLLYFQRTGQLIDVDRIDDIAHPATIEPEITAADVLMTMVPTGPGRMRGLPARFPTSADPGAADRLVAARADVVLLRSYPLPDGQIRLYLRRPTAARR